MLIEEEAVVVHQSCSRFFRTRDAALVGSSHRVEIETREVEEDGERSESFGIEVVLVVRDRADGDAGGAVLICAAAPMDRPSTR